jgi:hypothetical protein
VNPRYPVFVISKGRWETRHTVKTLERCGVPYRIVIEPQEYDQYAAVIDPAKILVTPFSNLGQGSIPVRNFVWDVAVSEGYARHWVLDDNCDGLFRCNWSMKTPCKTGTPFALTEDFTERFENVRLSGLQYYMFIPRKNAYQYPPVGINQRVYSCILIDNSLKHRWRGRYNEDTDLSLRVLKDGDCTLLMNAFLIRKLPTMTVKGGNLTELYQGAGRLEMARSLVEQHPDVTKVVYKFGRWQHSVDYSQFRTNKLRWKPGVRESIPPGFDEHGMVLERYNQDGTWSRGYEQKDLRT